MCLGDAYDRKSLKAAIPKVKGMVGGRISNLIIDLN